MHEVFIRKNWPALWQTYTLARNWPEIAGKNIAKKSEPAYIAKDTLWIYVESSVFMQHMQQQKLSLLEKINSFLPDAGIRDIRWAMKPAPPEQPTPAAGPPAAPTREERDAFTAMTATIEDEQCRKALQRLWNKVYKVESL